MKMKKLASLVLALVMCASLAVPAMAAAYESQSAPTTSDLVVNASAMDVTKPQHFSRTFVEDGHAATLELIYEPSSQSRSGSESAQATEGTWTSKYFSGILSMSYKYDLARSGSQWRVSNARDHQYSAIGYSISNPSLEISRSLSTNVYPAEINASMQCTLLFDLIFTMTGVVNTTVSNSGIVTVSWN